METVLVAVLGLMIGSFLNVCIHRLPRGESIVSPGSHCPHCNTPVAWRDNIPVLSFVMLGGRCRKCRKGISPRYVIVEILNAVFWVLLYRNYGLSGYFYGGCVFFSLLLAVTMTDFETGYIPDLISLPGAAAGLVLSAVLPALHHETVWYWGLLKSTAGFLAGGGVLYITGWLGDKLFRRDSMGGGDIKLLAMIGSFTGWQGALVVYLLAPFPALPMAIYTKWVQKAENIPYGPFLAMSAAVYFVYGKYIIHYLFPYLGDH